MQYAFYCILFVAVTCGFVHSCSLSTEGSPSCWGHYNYGQSSVPADASSNQVVIVTLSYHTCSVSTTGAVKCWGSDGNGEATVPIAASSIQVAVAPGNMHTCSLSSSGGVLCWGNRGPMSIVPFAFTYFGVTLPCRSASFSYSTPAPTPSPTPGFTCPTSLFRGLPRMDLMGTPVGAVSSAPLRLTSEEDCRIACCSTPTCQGYSFALYDSGMLTMNAPVACLLANITQLIPTNMMSSGVLLSSL